MVKRDTSTTTRLWFRRSAGIFLLFCIPVLVANLFSSWFSSTALEKVSLLFLIIWSLFLALPMLRAPRQRQRVESLRMRMDEAPLFANQPALEAPDIVLPTTLTLQLSQSTYTVFTFYWLAMLAILLLFQMSFFLQGGILWGVIAAWFALGALVLGCSALAFYQRIEITSEALTVQHGWRRQSIPWQEARLFAVLGLNERDNSRPYLYELSSARTILRWTHVASGVGFALQPRDRKEYWRRLDELSAYIRFRTGLMLCDLR